MKFLLVIPVYNEEKIIERTLDKVLNEFRGESLASFLKGFDVEILVVDNASTDNTFTIVNEYIAKKKSNEFVANLRIIKILEKGKGIAILTGAREAEREAEKVGVDFFGFIDADLSIHPKFIIDFLREISQSEISRNGTNGTSFPKSNIDILVGSRFLNKNVVNRGFLRSFSSQVFSFFAHKILKIEKVKDTQCGLKIMNKKGLNEILKCSEKGWFLDLEFLARAERAGLYIIEKPVSWNEFEYKDRVPKLKIIRDSLIGVMAIFKIKNRLKSL